MHRTILLNPGPVNISERVRRALLKPDLCHREQEFSDLMTGIRDKLVRAFNIQAQFTSVLVSGSGTAALEMAIASCLSPGKTLLVIRNGVYGERISKIAETYNFLQITLDYSWGNPPECRDVEKILSDHPEVEVVAMVHHETTTGLLNPVESIGRLARKYERKFVVDCISSLGGDEIDIQAWGVDMAVGTANKCLQGIPGVSFVLFRKTELCRLFNIPRRSLYLSLLEHHKAQESGDTLFTPAIQAHYALDEALNELMEETVVGRIDRYRRASRFLREGFSSLGLEFLIPEAHRSNCLTALRIPEGVSYAELHDHLKKEGFVIYAGQGNLENQIFRVANMGDITTREMEQFIAILNKFLSPHDARKK